MNNTQQPQHPGEAYAAQYIKTLSDAGWQIHQAYKKGFDAGAVHVLMLHAQQLAQVAQSQNLSPNLRDGLKEAAAYLGNIAQGKQHEFAQSIQTEPEIKDELPPVPMHRRAKVKSTHANA